MLKQAINSNNTNANGYGNNAAIEALQDALNCYDNNMQYVNMYNWNHNINMHNFNENHII